MLHISGLLAFMTAAAMCRWFAVSRPVFLDLHLPLLTFGRQVQVFGRQVQVPVRPPTSEKLSCLCQQFVDI